MVVAIILVGILVIVFCPSEGLKLKLEEYIIAVANSWMYTVNRGNLGETLSRREKAGGRGDGSESC